MIRHSTISSSRPLDSHRIHFCFQSTRRMRRRRAVPRSAETSRSSATICSAVSRRRARIRRCRPASNTAAPTAGTSAPGAATSAGCPIFPRRRMRRSRTVSRSMSTPAGACLRARPGSSISGCYYVLLPGDYPHGFTRPYTTEALRRHQLDDRHAEVFVRVHRRVRLRRFRRQRLSRSLGELGIQPELGARTRTSATSASTTSSDADYIDWKLGVTKTFSNGFAIALGYTDTNAEEARLHQSRRRIPRRRHRACSASPRALLNIAIDIHTGASA